jgi:ATP-dependent DNA helicase RecQ
MRRFVENPNCRHRQICLHFGETPKWDRCDACDVCGVELEWMELKQKEVRSQKPGFRIKSASPVSGPLRDALKEWRRKLAKEMAVPAYVVLHDSTLDALCRQQPQSTADLLEVPGIGERRAERFGAQILEVIASVAKN